MLSRMTPGVIVGIFFLFFQWINALPEPSRPKCRGKDEVYIKWRPPISGRFVYNDTSSSYRRKVQPYEGDKTSPQDTYVDYYELEWIADQNIWRLNEWTKTPTRKGLYNTTEADLYRIGSQIYDGEEEEREIEQEPLSEQNQKQTLNEDLEFEEPSQTSTDIIDETAISIFCPDECHCTEAQIPELGLRFTRLDHLSENDLQFCRDWLKSYFLTDEKMDYEQSNLQKRIYKSLQKPNESYKAQSENNSWRAEIYLSLDCSFVYFDWRYQVWIIEAGLNLNCWEHNFQIQRYMSNDSATCLEDLPRIQQWLTPQRVLDDPQDTEEEYITYCNQKYKIALLKGGKNGITVGCT